jgi:hypothetical protein
MPRDGTRGGEMSAYISGVLPYGLLLGQYGNDHGPVSASQMLQSHTLSHLTNISTLGVTYYVFA